MLSKSKTLGVIVLANQCLEKLDLPTSRIISPAAKALGVSRKSGYEAARRLKAELEQDNDEAQHAEVCERENLVLRIQVQILKYQVEHPDIRFSEANKHLSNQAKSLCVRILRDFKAKLTLVQIAEAIGVPDSSLSRWDKEADENCQFPAKPERRGRYRHANPQDANRVVKAFEALEEAMTLEEFTQHYNRLYEDRPLDRRTITRILQAADLYQPKPRSKGKEYHGEVTVYFPGAQVGIDAKQNKIHFTGQSPESVTLSNEVAIDIATGAVLGDAVRTYEDAEGVKMVVIKAREECENLLAILADNRSSNTAAEAQEAMDTHSELGAVHTFPYNAQTNGHAEGFFGLFSRIVGPIIIDDTSRETIARSVHDLVWHVFNYFRNYSLRADLDYMSPMEYLRTYTVLPQELEEARKGLKAQQERSKKNRGPHPRLSDPVFCKQVDRIIQEHQFDVDRDKALDTLVNFDQSVIDSASIVFSAYSKRDGFDEKKRTFAYFIGIVRNKQKEVDKGRRGSAADVLRAQRLLDKNAVHDNELEEEQRQEKQDLKNEPERVVLKYADRLMRGRLRLMRRTCLERIREGLQMLIGKGHSRDKVFEKLSLSIRSLPDFSEDIKAQMVELLSEEIDKLVGVPSAIS